MTKIKVSATDLVWIFTEKLKSLDRSAQAVSIAIVPTDDGWTAIASKREFGAAARSAKRIQQVQKQLRGLYKLTKD